MELHQLFLVPEVPNETEIQDGVDGLAWEHANLFAKLSDIEIGSDEFVSLHKDLMVRYRELGDHLGFIQHSAMRLLQALLMTNLMALVVNRNETSESVCDKLQHLGHIITSALMYVHASHPRQWIPNTEWGYLDEDQRGIDFPITIPTEGEGNDDHR
jgi:hypothetical protein